MPPIPKAVSFESSRINPCAVNGERFVLECSIVAASEHSAHVILMRDCGPST